MSPRDRAFLSEHDLRLTLADQGGHWYAVRTSDGEVISEAPRLSLALRRARVAVRKRAAITAA